MKPANKDNTEMNKEKHLIIPQLSINDVKAHKVRYQSGM